MLLFGTAKLDVIITLYCGYSVGCIDSIVGISYLTTPGSPEFVFWACPTVGWVGPRTCVLQPNVRRTPQGLTFVGLRWFVGIGLLLVKMIFEADATLISMMQVHIRHAKSHANPRISSMKLEHNHPIDRQSVEANLRLGGRLTAEQEEMVAKKTGEWMPAGPTERMSCAVLVV